MGLAEHDHHTVTGTEAAGVGFSLPTFLGEKAAGPIGSSSELESQHIQQTDHVLVGNNILFYHEKAPFPVSGMSILGGLEYRHETDQIKCHECGEFHRYLPNHVRAKHGLTSREYKERHGLNMGTCLASEGIRTKMIAASQGRIKPGQVINPGAGGQTRGFKPTAERYNLNNQCALQLLDRIRKIAEAVGRTPAQSDLIESGLSLNVIYNRFGSLPNAMKLAGLMPRELHAVKFTRESLLALFVNAYRQLGRCPSCSDARRGLLPSLTSYKNYWKTWNKVAAEAGIRPNKSCNPYLRPDKGKTCPRGHLRNAANTYIYPGGLKKKCRICHREDSRIQRMRRDGKAGKAA